MKKLTNEKYNVIGMFGTCGNSTFRKEIMIPAFEKAGVKFFNPQVEEWNEECALQEALHMANDQIICFPITGETYGTGSLAETGYSLLHAVNIAKQSKIILMIDMDIDQKLKDEDPIAAKESLRSRRLVAAHVQKLELPNLYIVSSIEEMTELAIMLYKAEQVLRQAKSFELKAMPDWAKDEE